MFLSDCRFTVLGYFYIFYDTLCTKMINVINIMMWGSRSEVYRFSGDNSEIKRTNISFPFDELWAKGLKHNYKLEFYRKKHTRIPKQKNILIPKINKKIGFHYTL